MKKYWAPCASFLSDVIPQLEILSFSNKNIRTAYSRIHTPPLWISASRGMASRRFETCMTHTIQKIKKFLAFLSPKINFFIFSLFLLFWGFLSPINAKVIEENDATQKEPSPIGNFSLPTSQRPGPLLSFGQNIIDKNDALLFLFADDYKGRPKDLADFIPNFVYGLTDRFSVLLNTPIAPIYKINNNHSSGMEDTVLQFEHAFHEEKNAKYVEQATVVGNVTFPTGSAQKQPPTGTGALSYFLGTTYSRMHVDWLYFVSPGVVLTTSHKSTKIGNEYLYQAGFGRHILSIDQEWLFASLLEANGIYTEKNKVNGVIDPNSGGNVVYLTPSLWISSKKLIAQLGCGFPVTQHLFGNQPRTNYLLVAKIGWTF